MDTHQHMSKNTTKHKTVRILQIGRFHNVNQNGGVERHMQLLCGGLVNWHTHNNGLGDGVAFDITYLVAGNTRKNHTEVLAPNYRIVQAATFGLLFSTAMSPMQIVKVWQLHRQQPFDVVHMHFPNPIAHFGSWLLPKSVKRVISWHSDIVKQKQLLKFYFPFLKRIVLQTDALIAATPAHFASSTQIPAELPAEKRKTIGYGQSFAAMALTPHVQSLVTQLQATLLRSKHASSENIQPEKMIFALGRHVYYKGFSVLIDAMKQVNALLVLGGDGPLNTALRQQVIDAGLSDKVHFTGSIPEDDLAAYFHACDVFCLPSVETTEAFGLVQLEAMACSKPVVCTQLNNGVNVVNQYGITGLAVEPKNATALAQALTHLLDNPAQRKTMGQAGLARAMACYSVEGMTQQHVSLYKELLGFV